VHIFIDESGPFTGYHNRSISVVAALAIPDGGLRGLRRKYARMRPGLPKDNDEVKGRDLTSNDVRRIVRLLINRCAFFEVTAIHLGLHTEVGIVAYKQKLVAESRQNLVKIPQPLRPRVTTAVDFLENITPQLFVQALTTFELVHRMISHSILFFAQRRPYELSSFSWIVDGKEKTKVTNWENWLKSYAPGALVSLSNTEPVLMPQPPAPYLFDYSFLKPFKNRQSTGDALDPALLLRDFTFQSKTEMGLEFVDILANATRRALRGELDRDGWIKMHRLMIHRNDSYIKFILYRSGPNIVQAANYGTVLKEGFSEGGMSMYTKKNQAYAQAT
jgi:hypothetical protein